MNTGGDALFAEFLSRAAGGNVELLVILHDPAVHDEHRINLLADIFFRRHSKWLPKCGSVPSIVSKQRSVAMAKAFN